MAKKYTVAAQLYTLRDFLKTPADMAKTMARVKKIGYDAGQISGFGPIDPAELNKIMTGAGVAPIGAHVGLNEFRADVSKVIADCKAWGIQYVAIPWLPRQEYKTAADWKKLFKEFEGYAKRCAKDGIVVQYHNHMFEFEKFGIKNGAGGKTILDMLYEGTKLLQAELDFGWVVRGGHSPVAWATKMAGRLDQVHLKDWGVRDDQPVWRAVGEGGIDWKAVIKACKASGTKDFIVEQDSCPITDDPFLSLAISRKNLAAMGL
jgi:sugar phosphate isomerase/epimerase